MKNRNDLISTNALTLKGMRTLLFLAATMFTMAFTIPGCPNVDEMNQRLADLEKKAETQQKAISEMNAQLRTMNDEHNTMKQLVSQISTTVLEQKDAIERIDSSVKNISSRTSRPAAKAKPAKRRR